MLLSMGPNAKSISNVMWCLDASRCGIVRLLDSAGGGRRPEAAQAKEALRLRRRVSSSSTQSND